MSMKKEYDEEGREGLVKVPIKVLLKEALIENGKLKAYVDELEYKLKTTEERLKLSESKRCLVKLNYNGSNVDIPMDKDEWHAIVLKARCDEWVKEYKNTAETYRKRYIRIFKEWTKFLTDHKFGKDQSVPFSEEPDN